MEKNEDEAISDSSTNNTKETIMEEANLQFHWYLFSFFVIYLGSFLVPSLLMMLYVLLVFLMYFLQVKSFILIFTQINSLLALLLMPLVFVACYLLHLFFIALITRWLWGITEKKVPTKPGIIPRNIPSKTLNFYHIRSFMIKYPKYVFTKGIFPWLSNWMYKSVGTSKIGKGSTIEEQVCADKFISVGENSYVGVNSVLTSHLVDGIFGNISYFEIKLGDNVTTAGLNCIAPGTEIGNNAYLLPLASTSKFNTIKGDNYYFGIPLRKIFKKKISEFLNVPESVLTDEEEYRTTGKIPNTSNWKFIDSRNEKESESPIKEEKEPIKTKKYDKSDYALDFTTSSAISRVNIKFLAVYIPILWFSGMVIAIFWYQFTRILLPIQKNWIAYIPTLLLLPLVILAMYLIFFLGCVFFFQIISNFS